MITISVSRIKLVRESNHRYNVEDKHINSPKDAVRIVNAVLDLEHEAQEVLAEILLDNKNKVAGIMEISRGSINSSIVHPREVFRGAILHNAAAIILVHNHPSGEVIPSREDKNVTRVIKDAGAIVDIPLLDHIIVGSNGNYTSLARERTIWYS